jgi:hypothetical protein
VGGISTLVVTIVIVAACVIGYALLRSSGQL